MSASEYLYVEVSTTGATFPFWIKQDGAILAQTQVCRSKQEVAHVLRNYLRGLWRKGHISGREKMVINDHEVAEIWDLNRFKSQCDSWIADVIEGEVYFEEEC